MQAPSYFGIWMTLNKYRNSIQTGIDKDMMSSGEGNSGIFNGFGYYDVLSFFPVQDYASFSPEDETFKKYKHYDHNELFVNKFALRATAPSFLTNIDNKDKTGRPVFDYGIYRDHSADEDNYKNRPLLSIILLQYHCSAIKEYGIKGMTEKVMETIIQHNNSIGSDADKGLFAVYKSFGTMDTVILCRSGNFRTVFELLNKIRCEPNMLSSSYVVAAIENNADTSVLEAWRNPSNPDRDTRLSMRITLKPGKTYEQFTSLLESCLKPDFDPYLEAKGQKLSDTLTYSNVSGVPDLLVQTEIPIAYFGKYFVDVPSNTALPTSPNSCVLYSRTAIFIPGLIQGGQESPVDDIVELAKRQDYENILLRRLEDALGKHISNAKQASASHGDSRRILRGILSLIQNCFDLTSVSGNFDIRYMLDNFIEGFTTMVEDINDKYTASSDPCERVFLLEHCYDNLNIVRSELSEIVGDFSRSNRAWVEGRTLTHQGMGSSRKIVMLFYAIAMELSKNLKAPDSDYYLLIKSGGADDARTRRFFSQLLESVSGKQRRLELITLPEKHLFCLHNTLFRVSHELLHGIVTDARCKPQRVNYYAEFYARFLSYVMIRGLPGADDSYVIETALATLFSNGSSTMQSLLGSLKGKPWFIAYFKAFIEGVFATFYITFYRHYSEQMKKLDSTFLIDSQEAAVHAARLTLDPDDQEKINTSQDFSHFDSELLKAIAIHMRCLYKVVDAQPACKVDAEIGDSNYAGVYRSIVDSFAAYKNEPLYIRCRFVARRVLEYFSGRISTAPLDNTLNLEKLASYTTSIFRETFSDIGSIDLLRYAPTSYINIYTDGETSESLREKSIVARFRLMSVLKAYPGYKWADVEAALDDVIDNTAELGAEIAEMYYDYCEFEEVGITKPLEKYLADCVTELGNKLSGMKFPIRESFIKCIGRPGETPDIDGIYDLWCCIPDAPPDTHIQQEMAE